MMIVTSQVEISAIDIANIVTNGVESGISNEWLESLYLVKGVKDPSFDTPWYSNPDFYEIDFIIEAHFEDPNGEEGEFEGTKHIGPAELQQGLQVMADAFPEHFNNPVSGNDDAETADVFLQCVVLGDVVYG